jgi:hypothetical protein
MAALVYLVSLIYLAIASTKGLSWFQEIDLFLNVALNINKWLFLLAIIFIILVFLSGLIFTFILIALGSKRFFWEKLSFGFSCVGCLTSAVIFLPIIQGLVYWANFLMASSLDGTGITDPFKFWFGLGLTVFLLWG